MRAFVAAASILVAAVAAAEAGNPSPSPEEQRPTNVEHAERCFLGCKSEPNTGSRGPTASPLTREEISAGMPGAEAGVRACGQAVDASGVIVVRISIREDGVVNGATVTGRLELTPFAVCVERAVKSARFRRNQGGSLAYPFVLPATVRASDCGGLAPSKKVDAAALQRLTRPIGRCVGLGEAAAKISTRFSLDGKGVIRGAEAAPPHAGTRIGFCVERTLGCLIGSSGDNLPPRWEIAIDTRAAVPVALRPVSR